MTQKELNAYYKERGYYHKSDPRHAMNKERTGPSVMIAVGVPLPKKKPAEPKKKPAEPKKKRKDEKAKMAKGGYANCGASMPAAQKSTKMAYGGMVKKK